jgi:hypothetical protein
MFEFGLHNVNGVQCGFLPAENFERVLPAAGWRIDYLGPTTYVNNFSPETFASMSTMQSSPALEERMKPLQHQLEVIGPLLENHVVYMPFWSVVATRVD